MAVSLAAATVFVLANWGTVDNAARAQSTPPAPANVRVIDGDTPGDVIISWDAMSGAKYYRVGWVAYPDYVEISEVGGRPWSEAFAFVDFENLGQPSRTIRRLTPGTLYAFRVGTSMSVNEAPTWSGWTLFTLQSGSTVCPANSGTPAPTPTGVAEAGQSGSMPANFKVALIGDQGLSSGSRAVLEMIRDEGADMVLHQGDFDYYDDPERWDDMLSQILGDDYPYFASIGNHDVLAWDGYQSKLQERLARIDGAVCTGDLGVNSFCTYKGLFFVLSGVGTIDSGRASYIKEALASNEARESLWRICSWHKNQTLMQLGGKGDAVGWEPYDECRKAGAIVATGHEHSYSRTHLMDSFENLSIASTSDVLHVEEGRSFAFVSGLAGHSIRGQDERLASRPWWAAVHTEKQGADHGALFCVLNHEGVENRGYCYFKDLSEVIPDAFGVIVGPADDIPEASSFVPDKTPKRDVEYDYTFTPELPDDWTEEREDRYKSPSPTVRLAIESRRFPAGRDIDQYFQEVQDNAEDDWEDFWFAPGLFEMTSIERETTNKQSTLRMRYRVQEPPDYCVLDVIDIVLVSRIVTGDPQVFRLRSSMCESRLARRSQLREDVLHSFQVITTPKPAPYYTQFLPVKGINVKAHESVDPAALQAASEIVDVMLSGRKDIAHCMPRQGADLAIIPRDQVNTDLPEFAHWKGTEDFTGRSRDTFDIRGLGGVEGQPVSSAGEEQLLGNWESHHPWYPYLGHMVAHEYAHAVQNLCFTDDDHRQWNSFYEEAREAGLYPGAHMMYNVREFFAVFSAAYFEVTDELGADPDRETFRDRFPEILKALDDIYHGGRLAEKFTVRTPRPQ